MAEPNAQRLYAISGATPMATPAANVPARTASSRAPRAIASPRSTP